MLRDQLEVRKKNGGPKLLGPPALALDLVPQQTPNSSALSSILSYLAFSILNWTHHSRFRIPPFGLEGDLANGGFGIVEWHHRDFDVRQLVYAFEQATGYNRPRPRVSTGG